MKFFSYQGGLNQKFGDFVNPISLPDVFGTGSFMASMSLFKTANYNEAYMSNPKLSTGDALFVGKLLQKQ